MTSLAPVESSMRKFFSRFLVFHRSAHKQALLNHQQNFKFLSSFSYALILFIIPNNWGGMADYDWPTDPALIDPIVCGEFWDCDVSLVMRSVFSH
jgi:hypothetical protein